MSQQPEGEHISSIVIIDDDSQILTFLRHVLEGAGYKVRQASDGRAGLRMIQQAPPDLVITDVFMPEQGWVGSDQGPPSAVSGNQSHCSHGRES